MTVDGLGELRQKRDKAKASHLSRNVPPPLNPRKRRRVDTGDEVAQDGKSGELAPDGVREILSTHEVEQNEKSEPLKAQKAPVPVVEHFDDDVYEAPRRQSFEREVEQEELGESTRPVAIYVVPETKRLASKAVKRQRTTNATIALDALDKLRDQLHELVEIRQTRRRPENSMFSTRRATKRRSTPIGVTRAAFPIRVLESDYEILEELAAQHGASGISELVSVALEAIYSRTRTH